CYGSDLAFVAHPNILVPSSRLYYSFFSTSRATGDVLSFPTRRSSDLGHAVDGRLRLCSPRGLHAGFGDCSGHARRGRCRGRAGLDRKSTRLNSSHVATSDAVFCLEKKRGNFGSDNEG